MKIDLASYTFQMVMLLRKVMKKTLEEIKLIFVKNINMILPKTKSKSDNYTLNYIHKFLSVKDLNSFRLEIIHKINNTNDFRKIF